MPSSRYESIFAKKVNYALWRDMIKGPENRFHSAFEFELPAGKWKCIDGNRSSFPEDFVLNYMEKKYLSVSDTNMGLLVKFALCESVRSAHEFLFTTLLRITNPAFPLNYPNSVEVGDVYFSGYWARDNLVVCVESFLTTPVDEKQILEISAIIDSKIKKLPSEPKEGLAEAPAIKDFTIQTKTVPIGENVPMRFTILHEGQCKLLFSASGGKLSCKAGIYFYQADSPGKHTIHLYVTDLAGKTSQASIAVNVVE